MLPVRVVTRGKYKIQVPPGFADSFRTITGVIGPDTGRKLHRVLLQTVLGYLLATRR
jgi:hypothetical protein